MSQQQSRLPLPIFLQQSPAPTSTPLPSQSQPRPRPEQSPSRPRRRISQRSTSTIPSPKLLLEITDLSHPGANRFLTSVIADVALSTAVSNVLEHLYDVPPGGKGSPTSSTPPPSSSSSSSSSSTSKTQATPLPPKPNATASSSDHSDQTPDGPSTTIAPTRPPRHTQFPPCRSITLLLRPISGVAYTTGKELDNAHKEIHLSLPYIESIRATDSSSTKPTATPTSTSSGPLPTPTPAPSSPVAESSHSEILGVLTHETVHCLQHASGAPPGGLIEGIADWVRLRSGLAPAHWKRTPDSETKWDQGYAVTAWFLDWLDERGRPSSSADPDHKNEDAGRGKDAEQDKERKRTYRSGDVVRDINAGLSAEAGGYKDGVRFWKDRFGKEVEELWQEYLKWLKTL
ncbi:MAG: hypothetical protein M1837_003818 [Sclerophora amabilis]|nr:MAG: hypothetical protein M1837_003818 [Sclerophora amabilis]